MRDLVKRNNYLREYKKGLRAEGICTHCAKVFVSKPHVICTSCRRKSIHREFERQVRISCGLHTPEPRYPEAA